MIECDFTDLLSPQFLLEVPSHYSKSSDAILERFRLATSPQSKHRLSSYRCARDFKLDLDKSLATANSFRSQFERLVVLGTGGSSLGAKALLQALAPKCDREVIFVENLDATDLPELSDSALKKCALVAISKSGNTLETLLALEHFAEKYSKAQLPLPNHMVAITDQASKGPLAQWALRQKISLLAIDALLGGRWSVTSAVGAFPLAFAGLNVTTFLGAVEKSFAENPSKSLLDFALRLADMDHSNMNIHSLWLYSSRLKEVGSWWKQLWSESLGKKKNHSFVGAFALPATGAIDQHSFLQQLAEGKPEAVTGFVHVKTNHCDVTVSRMSEEFSSKIGFARGKSWNELLQAQGLATRKSLQRASRPTYSLTLHELSEESLGELMAFWMDVTALVAAAMDINAFDQPGVELGKKLLPEILS